MPRAAACLTSHSTWSSSKRRVSPFKPEMLQPARTAVAPSSEVRTCGRACSHGRRSRAFRSTTERVGTAQRFVITTRSCPRAAAALPTAFRVRLPLLTAGGLSKTATMRPRPLSLARMASPESDGWCAGVRERRQAPRPSTAHPSRQRRTQAREPRQCERGPRRSPDWSPGPSFHPRCG